MKLKNEAYFINLIEVTIRAITLCIFGIDFLMLAVWLS